MRQPVPKTVALARDLVGLADVRAVQRPQLDEDYLILSTIHSA
jgi:hypothetical protein